MSTSTIWICLNESISLGGNHYTIYVSVVEMWPIINKEKGQGNGKLYLQGQLVIDKQNKIDKTRLGESVYVCLTVDAFKITNMFAFQLDTFENGKTATFKAYQSRSKAKKEDRLSLFSK